MAEKIITEPRDLPAVEELLQSEEITAFTVNLPRPYCVICIREELESARERLGQGESTFTRELLIAGIAGRLAKEGRRKITRVINATGILVHTNLGRAPLSQSQFEHLKSTLTGYTNLEFDLESGERGSRGESCEKFLALLAESESATVVNNCAAALFMILNTFATRKSVVISRGELVQIGGGFRIPDILKRSGAKLVEVGTSNMTSLSDYANAIDDNTALLLKVHKSNFALAGFTEEVSIAQLAELGKSRGIPVVHDLGSGAMALTGDILGHAETIVQQSVRDCATLTCFSADKLLGGSQAGIIVGETKYISTIRKNPLFRAVRADKIVFALLEHTATVYLENRWREEIPLWRLASTPISLLTQRANKIVDQSGFGTGATVVASEAQTGGGSLPDTALKSVALRIDCGIKPRRLIKLFRDYQTPIIGRISQDSFLLDLKAVDPTDDTLLAAAIKSIAGK